MAGEALDRGGNPVLTTGFYGGSFIESRVGLPPSVLLNVGDSHDRQIVFYNGVAQLAGPGAYQNYWRPGGAMSSLKSEFSVAYENAKTRAGVRVPENIKMAIEARIEAYVSCMGLADGIQHCDGTMAVLAEQIVPQEHELALGWNKAKAEMMLADPAIVFPLLWIREYSNSGVLPYYWSRQKDDPTSIPTFINEVTRSMQASADWARYRVTHRIPDGIEQSLIKIAMAYHIVEDLPYLHRALVDGTTVFTDPRAYVTDPGTGAAMSIATPADASNCGFLPFDDVYYSLVNPVGILRFKQIFPKDPSIIVDIENWFRYADDNFSGSLGRKRPCEISVKDLKRQGKVWDLLIGGSQGSSLGDFTKFGEAVFALCNLYNMPGEALGKRADVLGHMVGEAVYIKTRALMAGIPDGEFMAQIQRVLSLGPLDTPAELEKVSAGVLGAQGVGFFGALQVVRQFGLNIGTENYKKAVAMLKTGVKDPDRAIAAQGVMIAASAFNRLMGTGSAGGKKR